LERFMVKAFARVGLVAFCLACGGVWSLAQEPLQPASAQEIVLTGTGVAQTKLTLEKLAALPAVEMDIAFMTSKGEQKGHFKGPLVWTVLKELGHLDAGADHRELKRTFAVLGRDGYEIVFSVGEIAPDFGNTPALIALQVDRKALPVSNGLRLVVPGDKRGARNVRDIVKLEVR
jgi:hypothetical protein